MEVQIIMKCIHDILGEHDFKPSKGHKPLDKKKVVQIQQKILKVMLMGAKKVFSDPKEAAEFMIYR